MLTSYPVTVTSVDGSAETKVFFNEARANRYMTEEMKWESTVRVVCIPLGVDVEGDFVNVSHTFKD